MLCEVTPCTGLDKLEQGVRHWEFLLRVTSYLQKGEEEDLNEMKIQ